MGEIASQFFDKRGSIVGIKLCVVSSTRHRHVGQPPIHQLFSGLRGVHIDQHAVRRLPLATVARYRITVIEMGILSEVGRERAARIEQTSPARQSPFRCIAAGSWPEGDILA
jgi:hypothetical protein